MSVRKLKPRTYRVRWRDARGHQRQQTLVGVTRKQAEDFSLDARRRARLGEMPAFDQGGESLAEFAAEWWNVYAVPNLAANTLKTHANELDRHIVPRLGDYRLRDLTAEEVERFRADLHLERVGDPTIRRTLSVLQSILARAVAWNRIAANPVLPVRKPSQAREREVRPLAPATVEAVRGRMRPGRDPTLVSLLAYAGLRPEEALALTWTHIRDRTILVERAVALGEEKRTKTHRNRTVRLLGPLAQDLAEWRMAGGRPGDDEFVFPRADGEPWRDHDWRNWRKRIFAPAVKTLRPKVRPYDLRHSFVSLLIREGQSIVEVARQAGHSPQTCLRDYAHVFEEFDPAERMDAERTIREARGVHEMVTGALPAHSSRS